MARKNLISLFILIFIISCGIQANNQNKMETHPILENLNGISIKHKGQIPIFERVDNGKRGQVKATRTFSDGTHYSIIDPGMENFDNTEIKWFILAQINKKGIKKINEIISKIEAKNIKSPEINGVGFTPTINWYFHTPKEFSLVTYGGLYSNLPIFVKELDDAINANLIIKGEEE